MRSRDFPRTPRRLVVIAHNIRSVFNVGSIFRTAEGFGVAEIFLSGYTPNFEHATDDPTAPLLPHVRKKLKRELHKTALGAENLVKNEYRADVFALIDGLKSRGFLILALEQNSASIPLADFAQKFPAAQKIALILGEEVHGIEAKILARADAFAEIPMFGEKESFNVSVSAGIALYELAAR